MTTETVSAELLDLLMQAIARELQVSVQYMLQHGVEAGRAAATADKGPTDERKKFIASHSMYWLPGITLKKIAITEMRHAEAIVERVTQLGATPPTELPVIALGQSATEMLTIDRELEAGAIDLYRRIIALAGQERDAATAGLFQSILADEEKHHRAFAGLLAKG